MRQSRILFCAKEKLRDGNELFALCFVHLLSIAVSSSPVSRTHRWIAHRAGWRRFSDGFSTACLARKHREEQDVPTAACSILTVRRGRD